MDEFKTPCDECEEYHRSMGEEPRCEDCEHRYLLDATWDDF